MLARSCQPGELPPGAVNYDQLLEMQAPQSGPQPPVP